MKSDYTTRELANLKASWKPTAVATVLILVIYTLTVTVPVGVITYLLSIPPLLILCVTALVRVNDIGESNRELRWHARRFGLVLVGFSGVWLLGAPVIGDIDHPSWKEVLFYWGFALTWFTTPHMPPWWYYITGKHKELDPETGKRRPWWYVPGCPASEALKRKVEEGSRDQGN